ALAAVAVARDSAASRRAGSATSSFEAPGDAIAAKVVLCTRQRSSVVAAPKAPICASAAPISHFRTASS
ncbi:unnamed protein product, partial [Pylaiella littoralis]